jgi:hypothetical protein
MKILFHGAAVALLVTGATLAASAQTTTTITRVERDPVDLSPAQRTTIYRTVTRETVREPAPDVRVSVGTKVPSSVELRALPEGAYVDVPAVKRYKYMVVNREVVLVDPDTSQVVEIIHE